ncbi:MAG: hypothetical protein A2X36_14220 [Elusimicrobia bacterium GWA2_69_24]|nr:MAG: hypothetical protein A2X36_14220 [Elusimicrobia bacterium GWA2_69_24]HBL18197.1 hypothetical protein [Elusimicrobiota bacterium]
MSSLVASAAWAGGIVTPVVEVGGVGNTGTGAAGAGLNSGSLNTGSNINMGGNTPALGSVLPTVNSGSLSPRVVPSAVGQTGVVQPSAELSLQTSNPSAQSLTQTGRSAPSGSVTRNEAVTQDNAKPLAEPRHIPPGEKNAVLTPVGSLPPGGETVNELGKELTQGRKEAAQGDAGAVATKLDTLFDFSRRHAEGSFGAPESADPSAFKAGGVVAGLPDPKVVGVKQALAKVGSLAKTADAADAPFLYQYAATLAREQLPAAEGKTRVAEIIKEASIRAPEAMLTLGNRALTAASQGRTTESIRATKAVHTWNSILSESGRNYLANFDDFSGAVKQSLRQALDSPGKTLKASTVRFQSESKNGKTQLKAQVSAPDGMSPVAALPADLAEVLALPELKSFVAWEEVSLPIAAQLHNAFALTPQAGLREFYRSQRAAGNPAWKSFWIAARQFVSAGFATVWQRLKAAVVVILTKLGVLPSALPGLQVDLSSDAVGKLKTLSEVKAVLPSSHQGLESDALGLGYRLLRANP